MSKKQVEGASDTTGERLQKILSQAGVASRRLSEELITQGRVQVNGVTVTALGTKADAGVDEIKVDGRRIRAQARKRYILLHKPRGYITTRSDPEGRRTVLDLLRGVREYIYPVGRLDYDSEGLLLLTNDGDLAARLTHPRHEVDKVYEARVRGVPDEHVLERLAKGVTIEGKRTAPAKVRVLDPPSRRQAEDGQTRIELAIHEGRQRQVRQMFDAIGHPVVRLRRVRIGPIEDPDMPPGHWRELTPQEVARLQRAAGVKTTTARTADQPRPRRSSKPRRTDRPR
ncbi:MAG TPA: pseudouridine synthase [Vicinamibacterales bacterium]|jgi:pseudouridine synthase